MRTQYYKKAPHALRLRGKNPDDPRQLYKRYDTDNELVYELYPVDKLGAAIPNKPKLVVPNYHMVVVDAEERPKTFDELRPKSPMFYK